MPKSRQIVNLSSRSSLVRPKVDFEGGPRAPATAYLRRFSLIVQKPKNCSAGLGDGNVACFDPHTSRALTRIIVYMNPRILECYKSSSLVF